ncbi:hypothetical protein DTO166G4_178 [Paecilomyces variotii]|nr:hypothetical protein DTO032I3_6786 [Paecilomyces variotii]KAJ9218312.1 hypothetical protein DTO166G4_178 [Paecilomyces variotii]KAJ9227721.1 hypothetical protein DTO166G5_9223 [Paecilomyces variotii]KAJ9233027.1 hypothetical protein DTO169E5_7236 [Paecilomyces variotii]KAJ9250054.1 hypothetical protein DTO207G8_6367 [Paecilomyces variotii]
MAHIEEDRLDHLRTEVENISRTLGAQHGVGSTRDELLHSARRIVAFIDSMHISQEPRIERKQLELIEALQNLAYYDADSGGVKDLAEWCMQKWLTVLEEDPENWQALKDSEAGLGHAWLFKSQVSLAKIHGKEESAVSTMELPRPSSGEHHSKMDDENVLHGADYVEARGTLQPSTEYFSRAVRAAEKKHELTGELLVLAAESFMSLGNVSYPDTSIQYFTQAVKYLRMAEAIPGYSLPAHLSQYLQEYGRLIP